MLTSWYTTIGDGSHAMIDAGHTSLAALREALGASDPDVRTTFLDSLRREERTQYLSLLESLLEETAAGQERTDAPILMAVVGGSGAVPLLLQYLDAPNPNVIADVADALGIIADPTLLEVFETLDSNPASAHDWVSETIGCAQLAVQARAALAAGADAWAAFESKSAATLNSQNLKGLTAPDADFSYMYIETADLRGANLAGAQFTNAHLFRSDFCGARLTGADFVDADLVETCLRGADLTDATGLTRAQLRRSFTDPHTHLPVGLTIGERNDAG